MFCVLNLCREKELKVSSNPRQLP